MPSAEFTTAYNEVKNLKQKPTDAEQLELYALAKIAQGEEPKPASGMFDFAGKAKVKEFNKLKEQGITADDAAAQYVAKVNEFKTKYGYDG